MRTRLGLVVVLLSGCISPALGESGQGIAKSPAQATSASAKKPQTAAPVNASMKVMVVRSADAGCEPQCAEWISAQGMIDGDTLPQFKKVLKALGARKLPILIDSGGGVVDDSLAIGRLVRSKNLDVVVTKTVFEPCAKSDRDCAGSKGEVRGRPVAKLSKCASSCAFILAGGARRFVGPMTFVGVHQMKTLQTTAQILQKFRIEKRLVWGVPTEVKRTLISEKRVNEKTFEAKTPDSAYRKISKYFNEMGVDESLMPMLKDTPNSSIHWLTRAELKTTAMATDTVDGEQIINAVGPAPRPNAGNTTIEAFKAQASSAEVTAQCANIDEVTNECAVTRPAPAGKP